MMEEGNGRNWSDLTDITSKLLKEKRILTQGSNLLHWQVDSLPGVPPGERLSYPEVSLFPYTLESGLYL